LELLKGCQFHIHCSPILQDKIPYSKHNGSNYQEARRHKVRESQGVKTNSQTLLSFFPLSSYILLGMVNPFLVLALGTCVSNPMSPFFPFNVSQKEEGKK